MNVYHNFVQRLVMGTAILFTLTPSSYALSWIEKNLGQAGTSHDYIIRAEGLTALTSGAYVDLLLGSAVVAASPSNELPDAQLSDDSPKVSDATGASRVRLQFVGANANASLGSTSPLSAKSNYFKGKKEHWISNVPHFSEVSYSEIYPGIDVVYRLNEGKLEYDFIVAPEADSSVIKLAVAGASKATVSPAGVLEATTEFGVLSQSIPAVYQLINGEKRLLDGAFAQTEQGYIGFKVAQHRSDHAMVIDPVVEFSGYVGSNVSDRGFKLQQKPNGNLVLLGSTTSSFEPAAVPADNRISTDVFLAELDRTTGELLWITVLGGGQRDSSENFRIDSEGNSVLVGYTSSEDFPILNAFQSEFAGNGTTSNSILNSDGFVTKVSADGSSLIFSTYLGGLDLEGTPPEFNFGFELFRGIAIDGDNNIYIAGQTSAPDFPVTSVLNDLSCVESDLDPANTSGGSLSDVTFTKFSSSGALSFSTCIGGALRDAGRSVLIEEDGSVLIAGFSRSSDFPVTPGAYQTEPLEEFETTPFVLRLSPDYSQITMSTMVGDGFLQTIDVDGNGDIYGVSTSRGLSITTAGAYQVATTEDPSDPNSAEGYVFKLSEDGTALLYGTYLGAEGTDQFFGIKVDDQGRAIVAGISSAPSYPLVNALDLPDTPLLRNTDLWFPSSGYNHITRGSLADEETEIGLISREGNNFYAAGDFGSLGQLLPFFPSNNLNTAAMAYSQDLSEVDAPSYAAAANRDGPNEIHVFDNESFVFDIIASSTDYGNDSRAVEANVISSPDGSSNFYFGNYGEQNVLVQLVGSPPQLVMSPTGRSDGNTTALARISLPELGVPADFIAVANEFQDIRLYATSTANLGLGVPLNFNVGPVTALAAGDFDADGISELVVASSDRSVEIVSFSEAGVVSDVDILAGADSDNLSILVADIDNDSDKDILVGRLGDDRLFLNDGSGSFTLEPSYVGSPQATKSMTTLFPTTFPGQTGCPCFSVVDQNPQELLIQDDSAVVLSVLSADGSALELSTFLGSGGIDSIFRGLNLAPGSDSKLLIAIGASGDDWPLVGTSRSRFEASDAAFMVLELDQDGDNTLDGNDNCTQVANGDQNDTDDDGYGNACDADFNNDCIVNFLDVSAFAGEFLGSNPLFDVNGDGMINFLDFVVVSEQFLSAPGPGLGECDLAQ